MKRYLIKLTPMRPFFFGGEVTFGKKGDKENSSYLVKSQQFPQQTTILGALRKEMLIQAGLLTKKVNGEWIDKHNKEKAIKLVGESKFKFNQEQSFGELKSIEPIFLIKGEKKYIKKFNPKNLVYKDGILQGYNPKVDIYDGFVSTDNKECLTSSDIFKEVEKIGIKKGGGDDAFFKQSSYLFEDGFAFGCFIESSFELKDSFIKLGADNSIFKMEVKESEDRLEYQDPNGYLVLLSDSYIDKDISNLCDYAITSEINFKYLDNEFKDGGKFKFKKSHSYNFYEKGSIFVNPKDELIEFLNNKHLQKVGYNHFAYKN